MCKKNFLSHPGDLVRWESLYHEKRKNVALGFLRLEIQLQ